MPPRLVCVVESLEPRHLMSTAHGLHGKHQVAPLPTPVVTPAPALVVASAKRGHHATAAPAATFLVAGGLPGVWSGGQSSIDNKFEGTISVTVFQGSSGGTYAILKFNRPSGELVTVQSQFTFYPDGRFLLLAITPRMAMKFTGMIFNHGTRTSPLPTMNGSMQYWDRNGTYRADFAVSPEKDLQLG